MCRRLKLTRGALEQSCPFASNSVYYLLQLWSRMVTSVAYLKGEGESNLDRYVPEVMRAYIVSKLQAAQQLLRSSPDEDPMENEEQLVDQLDSASPLCRYQYDRTAGWLSFPDAVALVLALPVSHAHELRLPMGTNASPASALKRELRRWSASQCRLASGNTWEHVMSDWARLQNSCSAFSIRCLPSCRRWRRKGRLRLGEAIKWRFRWWKASLRGSFILLVRSSGRGARAARQRSTSSSTAICVRASSRPSSGLRCVSPLRCVICWHVLTIEAHARKEGTESERQVGVRGRDGRWGGGWVLGVPGRRER